MEGRRPASAKWDRTADLLKSAVFVHSVAFIQGLELDYSIVAWDADYRYVDSEWTYNNFVGNRWTNVSSDERRLYLKNAYRVLLTRARQGMAIFVPEGSDEDQTRKREWYNGIFNYLKDIGINEI